MYLALALHLDRHDELFHTFTQRLSERTRRWCYKESVKNDLKYNEQWKEQV